jgi:hypothetical protein
VEEGPATSPHILTFLRALREHIHNLTAMGLQDGYSNPSCQFSGFPQFVIFDRAVLLLNSRVLDVAHSRFVAQSPQVMMASYG